MQTHSYILPGGYPEPKGGLYRQAVLRPLTGNEEELLAEVGAKESASLVTRVLGRCLVQLGDICPVTEETVRELLVADRQFLLLKLREITFGDRVQASVSCPRPDCGKKVDIDFSTTDIPVKESTEKGPLYRMELSTKAAFKNSEDEAAEHRGYKEVTFRLPNGGDQEAVSPLLRENEARALNMLLERCVQSIGPIENPGPDQVAQLSPTARMEIEKHMAAVAPHVTLDMTADCPECRREFSLPFDLHDFFFGELRTGLDLLYRDVHYLAYHYHWPEHEILEMTREKRHRYIDILTAELQQENVHVE